MLFENEKKTANGQQEGRCANAREGGRSIACCWFCIFKEDKPSRFKQSSDIESLISPAADFAFSNKTNHLNLNKQEHPFQFKKKVPGCESFPSNTLCFQDCPVPIFGMGNGSQWFFSSRVVAFFASVFPPPVLCCCSLVGPCWLEWLLLVPPTLLPRVVRTCDATVIHQRPGDI